jgi:HAE1 family hydrophobic/amphiphilic exporter-1
MPKGFMPVVDQGFAFGGDEAAQDTSFDEMLRLQLQVNKAISTNPWIEHFGSGVGGLAGGQNAGFAFFVVKPVPNRPKVTEIIAQLQQEFAKIPGLMVFLQSPPLITLGQNEGRSQYSLALQDADLDELYKWAPVLEAKLHTIPELTNVFSDLRLASPRLDVHIDRNLALAMGVTPDTIANTLYDAYGNRRVTTITAASDQYDVVLEVLPQYQRDPASLRELYIRSNTGKMVPLAAVSEVKQTVAPLTVSHIGQLPAINFQFDLKPGVALSEATAMIDHAASSINLPSTVIFSYQGTTAAFQDSLRGLGILLLIAVLVIYLVLGVLYESFIHPIHHGRLARHLADRVWNRRGRRSAASVRHRCCGRLGGFAATDSLHHACDLPVSRPLGFAQEAQGGYYLNDRISSTGSTRVSRRSLPIEAGSGPLRAARAQTPPFR